MQSSELRGLIQGGDGFVSVIGLSYFSLHSPGGDELLSVIGLIFTFSPCMPQEEMCCVAHSDWTNFSLSPCMPRP